MNKYLTIGVLLFATSISIVSALEPCGTHGIVYDQNGNPAGFKFYTITVTRIDSSGSAGYYYRPFDSYYNVGCGQGLVAGDWYIYATINDNGTNYYSDNYDFYDWHPHISLGRHDLHCTRTTPPPPIYGGEGDK